MSQKLIIFRPLYGLCNRLRTLASICISVQKIKCQLKILWIPDEHCNVLFHDIVDVTKTFNDNVQFYDRLIKLPKNIKLMKIISNYNIRIPTEFNTLYIESNCIFNGITQYHLQKFFKSFFFRQEFYQKINNYNFDYQNMIAIHIRMGGGLNYTLTDADKLSNWSCEQKDLMIEHRFKTHFINFLSIIFNSINKYKIYLCTDDRRTYQCINHLTNGKIYYQKIRSCCRNKSDVIGAIIDMIISSRCLKFYGSYWSSFSEVIGYMREYNNYVKLLGSPSNVSEEKISAVIIYHRYALEIINYLLSIICIDDIILVLPSWVKCDYNILFHRGIKIIKTNVCLLVTMKNIGLIFADNNIILNIYDTHKIVNKKDFIKTNGIVKNRDPYFWHRYLNKFSVKKMVCKSVPYLEYFEVELIVNKSGR